MAWPHIKTTGACVQGTAENSKLALARQSNLLLSCFGISIQSATSDRVLSISQPFRLVKTDLLRMITLCRKRTGMA